MEELGSNICNGSTGYFELWFGLDARQLKRLVKAVEGDTELERAVNASLSEAQNRESLRWKLMAKENGLEENTFNSEIVGLLQSLESATGMRSLSELYESVDKWLERSDYRS